jgi:hypothetical protein
MGGGQHGAGGFHGGVKLRKVAADGFQSALLISAFRGIVWDFERASKAIGELDAVAGTGRSSSENPA